MLFSYFHRSDIRVNLCDRKQTVNEYYLVWIVSLVFFFLYLFLLLFLLLLLSLFGEVVAVLPILCLAILLKLLWPSTQHSNIFIAHIDTYMYAYIHAIRATCRNICTHPHERNVRVAAAEAARQSIDTFPMLSLLLKYTFSNNCRFSYRLWLIPCTRLHTELKTFLCIRRTGTLHTGKTYEFCYDALVVIRLHWNYILLIVQYYSVIRIWCRHFVVI